MGSAARGKDGERSMIERPPYETLVPGKQHFRCVRLSAKLSTEACAANWRAAGPGDRCHQCELGRLHYGDLHPSAPAPRRQNRGTRICGECLRCGGTGMRIIQATGCCVSCMNRFYEHAKGRNAKGKPPQHYTPPHDIEIAIQHADGRIERRLVLALHPAEAIGRVVRDLPEGARLVEERQRTALNKATGRFENVCGKCGTQGLVFERVRAAKLERWHWCCAGDDPPGAGWQPAKVRQRVLPMRPDAVAAWLDSDGDAKREVAVAKFVGAWIPTAHPCTCGAGQVEAMLLAPGGRWRTRCQSCGSRSEE